jgi:hypothetical protein
MNCEMWQVANATNLEELIRIATKVGATTSEKLGFGARGEIVGALAIPKDFQIVKA